MAHHLGAVVVEPHRVQGLGDDVQVAAGDHQGGPAGHGAEVVRISPAGQGVQEPPVHQALLEGGRIQVQRMVGARNLGFEVEGDTDLRTRIPGAQCLHRQPMPEELVMDHVEFGA